MLLVLLLNMILVIVNSNQRSQEKIITTCRVVNFLMTCGTHLFSCFTLHKYDLCFYINNVPQIFNKLFEVIDTNI